MDENAKHKRRKRGKEMSGLVENALYYLCYNKIIDWKCDL